MVIHINDEIIMDKNEFFREATIRICGNLEIEKALFSTLEFIRSNIPVNIVILTYNDEKTKSMRTLAKATLQEYELMDMATQISKQALKQAKEKYNINKDKIIYFEKPEEALIVKERLAHHKIKATSVLVIALESGSERIGTVTFILTGNEKLNQLQIEYLSTLKEPFAIALSNHRKLREVTRLKELLADDNKYLHQQLRHISGDEIIGANYGLKDVMQKIHQVAPLDSPVILLGETGTGKDIMANAIHQLSSRSEGPFISVNCGAIPDNLIDSELFGHEKGAFTGAISQKRGRFERADKGTIFLDEIGELPLEAQTRLLRVLQSREIERVGGTKTISLDIRIIAATNRDLQQMVKDNKFREDLWFRLNVFPINIPPLRDRKTDIPALLQYFIELKAKELKLLEIPFIKPGAIECLVDYNWPGNVRELQNIVERELILNPNGALSFENFKIDNKQNISINTGEISNNITNLDYMISRHIKAILEQTKGKIHGEGGAAELLGINASTLRNKMNKLGIKYGRKST